MHFCKPHHVCDFTRPIYSVMATYTLPLCAALQEENSGGREQCRGKDVRVKQLESQLCVLQHDGRLLTSQLQVCAHPKASVLFEYFSPARCRKGCYFRAGASIHESQGGGKVGPLHAN